MKKYVNYIIIGMKEHLVYPSAMWAKFFSKILYLYLHFSIWNALFSSNSQINPVVNQKDTLNYIVVATIISALIECNTNLFQRNAVITDLYHPLRPYRILSCSQSFW